MSFSKTSKQPSGFLPVAMSFAALAMVLSHAITFGVVKKTDEGTAAHVFEPLVVAEVPIVAFLALTWLPRFPRQALEALAAHRTSSAAAQSWTRRTAVISAALLLGGARETPVIR